MGPWRSNCGDDFDVQTTVGEEVAFQTGDKTMRDSKTNPRGLGRQHEAVYMKSRPCQECQAKILELRQFAEDFERQYPLYIASEIHVE